MKLTAEQVNKLKGDVQLTARLLHPEWRLGQAYFNFLAQDYPELAKEIAGTDIDPFYVDDRINDFLKHIQE
jgi:hypothetical protein